MLPAHLNPLPTLPNHSGFKVGSIDVEIPTSELDSTVAAPDNDITSLQFRIFYPCPEDAVKGKVSWLPEPERVYMEEFSRFLGMSYTAAKIVSYLPLILYHSYLPVCGDAPLLPPPSDTGRYPVLVFSHGLGGTRNMYSHILGSIASHGVVVIAVEHRDGSCPITFIHKRLQPGSGDSTRKPIKYNQFSHDTSPEVESVRNDQLRIRLWELSLIYDALLKIDAGHPLTNYSAQSAPKDTKCGLDQFEGLLNIQQEGSISWMGHSFGSTTVVQFVKSVYYSQSSDTPPSFSPLYIPTDTIRAQVTPKSLVILLDLWCMPLESPAYSYLLGKPLPCYHAAPGEGHALAIASETFRKWGANFDFSRKLLSPDSLHASVKGDGRAKYFYVESSAHLSQSDIGLLFPFASKRFLQAKEPHRILRLNLRAILQMMREAGHKVSKTSSKDMEEVPDHQSDTEQDYHILSDEQSIRSWIPLDLVKI